jgi:hypothetical protein
LPRQAGQLLDGDALAADERLLAELVQHPLHQGVARFRLCLPQHPGEIARVHGGAARLRMGSGSMSEYQYYEFLALDRPLTAEQRAESSSPPHLSCKNAT